jgi:hypothetical protein
MNIGRLSANVQGVPLNGEHFNTGEMNLDSCITFILAESVCCALVVIHFQ